MGLVKIDEPTHLLTQGMVSQPPLQSPHREGVVRIHFWPADVDNAFRRGGRARWC
jgi:hypothetical protein